MVTFWTILLLVFNLNIYKNQFFHFYCLIFWKLQKCLFWWNHYIVLVFPLFLFFCILLSIFLLSSIISSFFFSLSPLFHGQFFAQILQKFLLVVLWCLYSCLYCVLCSDSSKKKKICWLFSGVLYNWFFQDFFIFFSCCF